MLNGICCPSDHSINGLTLSLSFLPPPHPVYVTFTALLLIEYIKLVAKKSSLVPIFSLMNPVAVLLLCCVVQVQRVSSMNYA